MVKIKPFDAAEFLQDDAEVLAYIRAALDDGDPLLVASALGDVARARGMSNLSAATGLSRESLYRSLSGNVVPTADTLFKVLLALDLKLDVQPIAAPAVKRKTVVIRRPPVRPVRKSLRPSVRTRIQHPACA